MKQNTWFKHHRWLLSSPLLACLALAIILTLWRVQAHQYQLALAEYNATHSKTITLTIPPPPPGTSSPGTIIVPNPDYHPPIDTSGPGAWGWPGWTMRILAVFVPALLGIFLHWREHRLAYIRIHKKHLDHATNKLAEAIGENQALPEGVFDAYSKLRELEKRRPSI